MDPCHGNVVRRARRPGAFSCLHGLGGEKEVKRYQTRYFRRHNDRELLRAAVSSVFGLALTVLLLRCLWGG